MISAVFRHCFHFISDDSFLYEHGLDLAFLIHNLFELFRIKEGAVAVTTLAELGESWKEADVIGVDEAQFYKDVSENLSYYY